MAVAGAIIGAAIGGSFNDQLGRITTILIFYYLLYWSCDHGCNTKPSSSYHWMSFHRIRCWNGADDIPSLHIRSFSCKSQRCPCQYQLLIDH
ncbi:hypothetical protein ACSBR1_013305 [Camellia fascicularis]